MKKSIEMILAEGTKKAAEYLGKMNVLQVKKVLFAMSQLEAGRTLEDCNFPEVRHIAGFYDGVILGECAKRIVASLATEYSKSNPGVLLTKKQMDTFTDARYRKLYDAVGHYGFDYCITAMGYSKFLARDPKNNIYIPGVLSALMAPVEESHKWFTGLKRAGLSDMATHLLEHVYTVGHVYEIVKPIVLADLQSKVSLDGGEEKGEKTKADMVADLINNARLLKNFYGTTKPEIPDGFPEEELHEGSAVYALAKQGMFKDSEAVLNYVEGIKQYEACGKRITEVFSEDEVRIITENAELVQEILRLVDSL